MTELKKTQHEYEKYPFGSWPRLVLAYRELTGEDLTDGQFDHKKGGISGSNDK